jgi:hypothetical protein
MVNEAEARVEKHTPTSQSAKQQTALGHKRIAHPRDE